MAASPEKLAEIDDRGFAIVEAALCLEECAVLKEHLQHCIDEDEARWAGQPYRDRWMVYNLMTRGAPFARLLEHPVLHDYLNPLLGATCILYAYTSSSMPPHGTNYSHRVHVDCPRFIPGYVTNVGVMFILDDFTIENGATYFLPGSHKSPWVPSVEEFRRSAVRVFPRAGDLVFFNARTFHMGGHNMTDRPRHAITMNCCRSYMRQQFDYPRLVSPEIVASLGEVGRRFLGFNVRMPSSLEEYYVPEEQRLYKANQG